MQTIASWMSILELDKLFWQCIAISQCHDLVPVQPVAYGHAALRKVL